MQDIMKEYGPAMITVVAIIAIVGLVMVLFKDGDQSLIGKEFMKLINQFFTMSETMTQNVLSTQGTTTPTVPAGD